MIDVFTLRSLTLPHNLYRPFILPQPDRLRMPQVIIRRPFGELDWATITKARR
jgi:hypothetical protein